MGSTVPYKDCIYCEEQGSACIFHLDKKEHLAYKFWHDIRKLKPKVYDGFIFPNFESYDFIDYENVLAKPSNFWDANETPSFKDTLIFKDCYFEDIMFINMSFDHSLVFKNCSIKNIYFRNSKFKNTIDFTNNELQTLSMIECNFMEPDASDIQALMPLTWDYNKMKEIVFNTCQIDRHLIIGQDSGTFDFELLGSRIKSISIIKCNIKKTTSINNIINDFSIDETNISTLNSVFDYIRTFKLFGNEIGEFHFLSLLDQFQAKNTTFKSKFYLQTMDDEDIQLHPVLQGYFEKKSNSSKLRLDIIKIEKECIFSIRDFNFKKVFINHFTTFSDQVVFNNINISEQFILTNSNMLKVQFNTIKISPFYNKITINSSNLADTIFNDVEWGNIANINANRDTFRQLKHANDKQSNYLTSHQFYAREMEEYSKTIVNKNLEEKIVFLLGKYISNFSQSWIMPLCWTIIVGIVTYLTTVAPTECLLISSALIIPILFIFFPKNEIYSYSFSKYLYAVTVLFLIVFIFSSSNFNGLASFINPFGSYLKENPQHHYFIWLLHKTISSFTVYHFIIALRRSTQR